MLVVGVVVTMPSSVLLLAVLLVVVLVPVLVLGCRHQVLDLCGFRGVFLT